MTVIISVDVMGGDHGVDITIPACIKFLQSKFDVKLLMVGDETVIKNKLANNLTTFQDKISIVHTTQIVEMDETPQSAMRNKKDSSMRVAINQVKNKEAEAVVSAGNTGALMATARYVLRTLDSIDRPAIAKLIPSIKGDVCMLDLGANLECSPENLFQFGVMGAQLMHGIAKKPNPSIGLLNIGSEDMKGHKHIKEAAELFKISGLNFYGNVEGDDINKGTVDVVVCDGFTGNVALKTMEGVAKMMAHFIKEAFTKNIINKSIGLLSYPVIKQIKTKLDTRKYNGAVLLGLNGLVIKSHGSADTLGFYYALEQAYHEVHSGFQSLLVDYLKTHKQIFEKDDTRAALMEFQDLSQL